MHIRLYMYLQGYFQVFIMKLIMTRYPFIIRDDAAFAKSPSSQMPKLARDCSGNRVVIWFLFIAFLAGPATQFGHLHGHYTSNQQRSTVVVILIMLRGQPLLNKLVSAKPVRIFQRSTVKTDHLTEKLACDWPFG